MATRVQDKELSGKLGSLVGRLSRDRLRVLEGSDPEALHDFRVALRRLRALLGLMKGFFPTLRLGPLLDFLKRTAKATNDLRDQEVLCGIWSSLPPIPRPGTPLRRWLLAQEASRAGLEKKALSDLASPALGRRLENLGPRLSLGPAATEAAPGIKKRFRKRRRDLLRSLRRASASDKDDLLLHRLRVETKRVRYALEGLDSLMPRRGRKLAAGCRKLQDALGEWRDLERAMAVLREGPGLPPSQIRPWLKELKARRRSCWRNYRKAAGSLAGLLG
jgi:CHAD domain-containing protein